MRIIFQLLLVALMNAFFMNVFAQTIQNNNRAALIIGIGEYESSEVQALKGIGADIESAKKIAKAMGIPEQNITVLRDSQATKKNMVAAFQKFSSQAANGGRAFIYYSGHGTRGFNPDTKSCYEGLLSYDRFAITNEEIAAATQKLNDSVDKTIVLFDACHSGGVLKSSLKTRSAKSEPASEFTPKFYGMATAAETEMCQKPINMRTRGFFDQSTRLGALQENLVLITAARPDEVSFDEGVARGGVATQAIRDCLLGNAQDLNQSGGVSLEEIRACSQEAIDKKFPGPIYLPHHVSIRGNRNLIPVSPVALASNSTTSMLVETKPPLETKPVIESKPPADKPTAVKPIPAPTVDKPVTDKPIVAAVSAQPIQASSPSNKPEPLQTNAPLVIPPAAIPSPAMVTEPSKPALIVQNKPIPSPVVPDKPIKLKPPPVEQALASLATLKDVEAQSNPTRSVEVKLAKKSLKVNQDYLDLQIKSNADGYLYFVLLGSDKKSFYILYPNKLDQNNFIKAGQAIKLPSQAWQIKAAGPVGADHLLVIVADSPRDLSALEALGTDPNSPFVYALNNLKGRATLIDYLTGKNADGKSEKFAAKLVTVMEVQ